MTAVAEVPAVRSNPINAVGLAILVFYLFLVYSRALDYLGEAFRIPFITMVALAAVTILSGAAFRAIRTRVGVLFVALTILMVLTVPFSAWPRLSLEMITTDWARGWLLYFAIAGMALTVGSTVLLLQTITVALVAHGVFALVAGGEAHGRYFGVGRFGDSNELGLACLIALCLVLAAANHSTHIFGRAGYYLAIPILFLVMVRTGSRGMFVTTIVVGVYLFFRASLKGKVQLAFLGWIVIALAGALAPEEIYQRYSTFASSNPEDDTLSAGSSFRSRQYLFRRSIELTLSNPLLGTGTGTFMIAENSTAIEEGYARGNWHQTHNSFTQISSENGVPALLLFLAICVSFWTSASRVESFCGTIDHREAQRVQRMTHYLRAALLALFVGGQFLSLGYSDYFPVLGGLAIALERAVLVEHVRWQVLPVAPAPAPQTSRWRRIPRPAVRAGA